MKKFILWLAGLTALSIALGLPRPLTARGQDDPKFKITGGEYEIYSSLIKQLYVKPENKIIVIADRTYRYDPNRGEDDEPWYDKPKGIVIDPSTVEDYGAKNTEKWVLDNNSFKLGVKCELVTNADLYAIFHGHMGQVEWLDFFKRFDDAPGFLMISRIGFNKDHNQAMVYMGSRCGPGCRDLHFLLLEKAGDSWKIKKELRKSSSM